MSNSQCDKPITPTVELNALAMKLNFQPVYTNLAPLSIKSKIQEDGEQSPVCKGDFRLNQVDQNERFLNADFQRQHTHTSQRFPSSSNQVLFVCSQAEHVILLTFFFLLIRDTTLIVTNKHQ
jgi:hypothetical protein